MENKKVTALLFLSFLRKQESIYSYEILDPRFRGDDEWVGNRAW
jgi:hypothetical protein